MVRVLRVDPALEGVAAGDDLVLRHRQRLARGDPDLLLHQVDAGRHLGDGVLDLDPGIHLDEVEAIVGVDQELARARVRVADGLGQPDGGLAQLLADLHGQGRRGRFLDELLVPALERAVAVPAVDDVAVVVGEDLDLDVPGPVDELLEVDARVLERRLGLVPGRLERRQERPLLADDPHPLPAAAGRGLDEDGEAHRSGQAQGLGVGARRGRPSPGRTGTFAAWATAFASVLRPIRRIASWGGPMNSKLQSRQISAKSGFSLRKP